MSKILIEKYKGFEIVYCTISEALESEINVNESFEAVSLTEMKKSIDKWIKKNRDIPPTQIILNERVRTIYGVHSNGNLLVENEDGEKHQIASYNFKDVRAYSADNEKLMNQIIENTEQQRLLGAKNLELRKQMTGFDAAAFVEKYK